MGSYVQEEVAHIEGRVCQTTAVKVEHKDPVSLEEQLARLEAAMGQAMVLRLGPLQMEGKPVGESLEVFS